MSHSALRRFGTTAAKALVSAGLIAFALRGIDSALVVEHIRRVDPWTIALGVAIVTAIALPHALRWQVVLHRMGHRTGLTGLLRLVLVGYFFNQTLPSTIGGDVYRAWGAYHLHIRLADAVNSVILDRILALVSLVVMIALGLPWLFGIIVAPAARGIVLGVIAMAALATAVMLLLPRYARHLERWKAARFALHLCQAARSACSSPVALAAVVGLTIVSYAALSIAVHVLARGMGVPLEAGPSLLLVPLVTLVTVLPISIAGWGLRESAMIVALGLIGVPSTQAFSLSVLFGLVVMASGIPGGVLWLLIRSRTAPPLESAVTAAKSE